MTEMFIVTSVLTFGFIVTSVSAFHQNLQSSDGNIWISFISKALLTQNDFKKCFVNFHLKNNMSLENLKLLKYLNMDRVKLFYKTGRITFYS